MLIGIGTKKFCVVMDQKETLSQTSSTPVHQVNGSECCNG